MSISNDRDVVAEIDAWIANLLERKRLLPAEAVGIDIEISMLTRARDEIVDLRESKNHRYVVV